jgi:hypothetical protein
MKGLWRSAVVAAVFAAAATGSALAVDDEGGDESAVTSTILAAAPDADAGSGAVTTDERLAILRLKVQVEDLKRATVEAMGGATTDEQKARYQEILATCDQIFSILEDMLQNG